MSSSFKWSFLNASYSHLSFGCRVVYRHCSVSYTLTGLTSSMTHFYFNFFSSVLILYSFVIFAQQTCYAKTNFNCVLCYPRQSSQSAQLQHPDLILRVLQWCNEQPYRYAVIISTGYLQPKKGYDTTMQSDNWMQTRKDYATDIRRRMNKKHQEVESYIQIISDCIKAITIPEQEEVCTLKKISINIVPIPAVASGMKSKKIKINYISIKITECISNYLNQYLHD